MGLTTSLNNAVSGLRVNTDALSIVSRNIANKGTPGYHKQSLNIVDYDSQSGSYARSMGTNRAFNTSLQTYYTRQVSDTSNSAVQATYLDRLQTYLGKPGSANSLDTLYGNLQNALQALSTSPEDYTVRADALGQAQTMAETLNRLSTQVQDMRQETEAQMATDVNNLNGMLTSLQEVNSRMLDLGIGDTARASLMDQRDRLVSSVSEIIDVQADYRPDGTVALMTRSGVGVLDAGVSTFAFEAGGNIAPTSLSDRDPAKNGVGKLTLTTPSGMTLDLVSHGILQGGELAGLVTLRDKTLVEAQNQLDEIAGGLAQAFSTIQTPGADATVGTAKGYDLDLSDMKPGNDVMLTYSVDGKAKQVRVINSTTPNDYIDANGQRVISLDLSGNSSDAAAVLSAKLPGLAISSPASGTLRILDGGTTGNTAVRSATVRTTADDTQGDLALSLFVDTGDKAFTNNLDGDPPQKTGFASRIKINSAVVANTALLVQSAPGDTLGNADRPNFLLDQLADLQFVSGGNPALSNGQFQLNGNLSQLIGQTLNFQGSSIGTAMTQFDDRQLTLDTVVTQMQDEYGVDTDEEMSRLTELQNSYAANARVVSVVKELLDALLNAV